ncbi:MAG: hypothetical protein HGB26_09115, partial [Desulfobulbaceae bacterium]|nr:hypothetical protein [Desulfobulbaceae bacterium]
MDIETFSTKSGIKYLGQYKPQRPYSLGNGIFLVPYSSGMFPYGLGGEVHLNVSYFASSETLDNQALSERFREWLVFDAFILRDRFPITNYDQGKIGTIENIPTDIASLSTDTGEYK